MTQLVLSLTDSTKEFLEKEAARRGLGTIEEALEALIRERQMGQANEELDAKLLEGVASPAFDMTEERRQERLVRLKKKHPNLDDS